MAASSRRSSRSTETALIDLINLKRAGKPITPKSKPAATNVVDWMEALRRSGRQAGRAGEGCQPGQEAAQGGSRPKGNADVDRGQEAGERSGGEKASQGAAGVGEIFETPGDWNEWGREESSPCPRPPKAPPGENLPPRLAVRMRNIAQGPFCAQRREQ